MSAPPKLLLWLLDKLCPPSRPDLKGDFLEMYECRREEWGRSRANWAFFKDILSVLPLRFFIKSNLPSKSSIPMFSHYVKIAFRSLSRSKAYSFINIMGLAVGMAVCLVIYQYVSFELSYDRFHKSVDNLYRITQEESRDGEILERSSYTTFGLGPAAKEAIPEVNKVVRVHRQYEGLIIINRERNVRHQEDEMWYVDSSFLHMFSFPLQHGDARTALNDPSSIVITADMARRYFGDDDPMGKVLRVSGGTLSGDFLVTGILEPLPANTHLQFDFLLPLEFLLTHWRLYVEGDGWDWKNFVTYVSIRPHSDVSKVVEALDETVDSKVGEYLRKSGLEWKMDIQPITDIHLHSDFSRDIARNNGEVENLYYFAIIGILVLLMAWVNYVNLATARAMHRAREVGIRKSIGAHRGQLILQFLTEALLFNSIAAMVSFGLAMFLLPVLNSLVGQRMPFDLVQDPDFWVVFLGLFISGSLLSGTYPAMIVSSFKPRQILKSTHSPHLNRSGLRKALIVFQFVASILLISGTGLVYRQINYMKNHDLGMDIETIVVMNGPRVILETLKEEGETLQSKYSTFRNLATETHTISAISATSNIPGQGFLWSGDMRKDEAPSDISKTGSVVFVDTTFFGLYQMEFVAGGIPEGETGEYQWVVINEEAVHTFGLGSPEEALQYKLTTEIAGPIKIAGVVRNPHWGSPKNSLTPIAFFLDNQYGAYLSAKINSSDIQESLSRLELAFHTAFPNDPLYYFFLNDSFNRQYQADLQFGKLFTAFSLLAIFISCLGLFALVSFSASLKTKEIGIRKVLGASVGHVMGLLTKEYLSLLLLASLLATPLIIWGGKQWLENYAFRINMSIEFVVVPVAVLLIVSVLTVSYKTWSAARANPVKALKTE